ncbi:secretin N-terminal domain-containing protein [Aeromonas schubertii]|uniref:General secretion pathway protein D n=1 Tax=Aeromonas schubertii TaxID=652 RepID=A0A0S2SFK0_9GAMM|nr:secretin N-terminal domain-containing protein [Aeromonas schubertii]ALP40484.1 general secretion pathway protein D [Aeromonas schubertii]
MDLLFKSESRAGHHILKAGPRFTLLAISLGMLAGCTINTNPTAIPKPIREPQTQAATNETLQAGQAQDMAQRKRDRFGITPSQRQSVRVITPDDTSLGESLRGDAISMNVNNFPLPAFINEVFGNRLGLSFTMTPELQKKGDLVTLRMSDPQPPAVLFNTARNVLADYGVEVKLRDGLYTFGVAQTVANDALPLMISGGALPDVPMSHRPVFQIVPMKVVRSDQMAAWLGEMFGNTPLKIKDDRVINALMLRGPIELVKQAIDAISLFDQPALKSSHSLAISPVYSDAEQLGNALIKVLQSEGYDVSDSPPFGGVLVLKMKELQRIIVFAAEPRVLSHVRQWVEVLDRESQEKVENGLFIYQVRNTQAASIATMLGALGYGANIPATGINSSNTVSATGEQSGSGTLTAGAPTTPAPTSVAPKGEQGSVVVDGNRNALIFKGSGREWVTLRPLLDELDKPVPSVMIDVLLAEVNLNDKEGLGVNWSSISTDLGAKDLILGTANELGKTGLTMTLNSAGQTRATLNAYYDNKQAVIRSSPKLMVRSGEEARIEVGNEIPVVTGTSQASDNPDAPINKTVQYRKTGVILTIKPTVQASGVVDLTVSQELSEQADTSSSNAALTPTIMNRKVETALTLRDGGSVMLAGLISSTKGEGDAGVPLLGDIPWIGSLFKTKSNSENRTELVVMIIPYVIRDFNEAQSLTERYQQQLELNNAPSLKRRYLPGMAPEGAIGQQ